MAHADGNRWNVKQTKLFPTKPGRVHSELIHLAGVDHVKVLSKIVSWFQLYKNLKLKAFGPTNVLARTYIAAQCRECECLASSMGLR